MFREKDEEEDEEKRITADFADGGPEEEVTAKHAKEREKEEGFAPNSLAYFACLAVASSSSD